MHFCFEEEQLRFQESVRGMLGKECSPETLRALSTSATGRSPELWAKLAEIGLLGLLVPEQPLGLGLSEVDAVLALEETGRAALAETVVETACVGARMMRLHEADEVSDVVHALRLFGLELALGDQDDDQRSQDPDDGDDHQDFDEREAALLQP